MWGDSTIKMYMNGELDGTKTVNKQFPDALANVTLGNDRDFSKDGKGICIVNE